MVSIIIVAISSFIILNTISFENVIEDENCINVNKIAGFVYDICYDSYTKNILMLVKKNPNDYKLDSFNVSFSDTSERSYTLRYNQINGSRLYRFYAEENPQIVYVALNVIETLPKPICKSPSKLFIKYCSTKSPGWGKGSLNGSEIEDYILLEDTEEKEYSDLFNLSEKEIAWESVCRSYWNCFEWESCEEGLQRRNCYDENNCLIPTYFPEKVRLCDRGCIESWECDWSECIDGFTKPTCKDKNECGSSYALPPKVSCSFEVECRPFIQCDEWSRCEIDYNLVDLSKGNGGYTKGVKSRICRDLNFCVEPINQVENCSIGVDVYTQKFTKCGIEFIGIYNRLSNKLIARIDEGTEKNPILNIHLDDNSNFYCDYCFNGIKDIEEEGIDCGEGCEECLDKYQETTFRKNDWWTNFSNWMKDIWNR